MKARLAIRNHDGAESRADAPPPIFVPLHRSLTEVPMKKPVSKEDREGQPSEADKTERATSTREQCVANRETWVRAREKVTGEHELVVHERESAVELREEALRARAEADAARIEREHLLVQMREANERLIVSSLRADELAEHGSRRERQQTRPPPPKPKVVNAPSASLRSCARTRRRYAPAS